MTREWLERTYTSFGSPRFVRDADGRIQENAPQCRYAKADLSELHKYGGETFCKFTVTSLPSASGVYVLCINETPRYVGKAVHLQKRFAMGYGNISPKNCYVGGQQTNCRINRLILLAALAGDHIELFALVCDDHDLVEKNLIQHLKPDWNRQGLL